MANKSLPEYWLRGPLPNLTPVLQPVAHALLQARDEVTDLLQDFNDALLWEKPAGVASVGFHLQHLAGVLDRLFTYARGEALSPGQLQYLRSEGTNKGATTQQLVAAFAKQVETALLQLQQANEATLLETRNVGRAGLPSTTLGLYVHAAEHTMRHTGQVLVTARILQYTQNT
ncbi:MAG TPA: DinB family protein [Chitinophagaceae bacterium]|nr:DinB family protein [Chitinophagaceae bacterium]